MTANPVLQPGRVAVITGAASGIGLAAAGHFAGLGMRLVMADADSTALQAAAEGVRARARAPGDVLAVATDVGKREAVIALKDRAYDTFHEVALLMNNAGRGGGGDGIFGEALRWEGILDTNLWGVIHGVQVFGPAMVAQASPGAIINTGSKQGITAPPGNTAYNLSKAGVKVVTEALAHELRSRASCQVTAHLLVPGFTFTSMTRASATEKPPGAWTPEQVVAFMVTRMTAGDFYIICPDNEVSRDIDNARILWAAMDITENRPPLSRWHPDYAEAFKAFLAERGI
jgi:NAD(P)-dependent dehydrogenase (short-subunit alcohol dehydrogenase family)